MRLRLDAWLERKDPRIRLFDADTGRELLRLGSGEVRELFDSGGFCPSDLARGSSRSAELIALLVEKASVRKDPTRLRMPSYMRRAITIRS